MRPGPVNNIENGKNLPSAKVLCKLAETLGVPIDTFFAAAESGVVREERTSYPYVMPGGELPLRAHAILTRTEGETEGLGRKELNHLANLVDAVLALEDLSGAQKAANIPLQIPFELSESGLLRLAGCIRHLLGISDAIIFDYLELLENAGLRILVSRLPAGYESLSCHDPVHANAFIFIAAGLNAERVLFRLLYELGRIYCYMREQASRLPLIIREAYEPRLDYRGKPFTPDRAARRFAALFLMPQAAVHTTVAQLGIGDDGWSYELLLRIKHRFGVSAEALLYRLDELGLIASARRHEINAAITAHYEASNYSEPDSTRRKLTPNGRIGDLLLTADTEANGQELATIRKLLRREKVKIV